MTRTRQFRLSGQGLREAFIKTANKLFIAGFAVSLGLFVATASASAAELKVLSGHVAPVVAHMQPVGRLPGTNRMPLAIGLSLRNQETLNNLLREIYDPASPNYHHYLTPEQFAEQFGPSQTDYQALISFAKTNGLIVTATHPNRMLLDVSGTVADIENAFHVTMRVYQHPKEARTFYSPDVEPSVPSALPVNDISGLNNYVLPHPKYKIQPATTSPKSGSAPGGNYMGDDFRAAYAPGVSLTGAGQTVGLLQFDGYFPSDIVAYETLTGRPNVPLENVLLNGFNGVPTGNGGDVEVSLDIEMVISMAPGVSKVILYEGGPFGIPNDILNAMATENRAKQIGCSWGWTGGPQATTEQIFQQMAAQGQTFFNATGDNDAFLTGQVDNSLFPGSPSSSPNITQVGGTTLTTSGPGGSWVSETVWNWGNRFGTNFDGVGSAGGISSFYGIPSWQRGIDMTANRGSTTFRNIPDVTLTGDDVYVIAENGVSMPGTGGTSCAAPLWAGYAALINQQAAQYGDPPIGFINPAIYSIGKSFANASSFHDITTGDDTWSASPTQFLAVAGYDLCAGWGTPTGTNLISLLAPPNGVALVIATNFLSGGNGNGFIDPDECNSLLVVLENVGLNGATNIQATLTTTTPGVIVTARTSPYPTMPAGAVATNLVPFQFSTAPSFVCGTVVSFALIIKSDQGPRTNSFTLPSGSPGVPLRFDATAPVPIPDLSAADSPVIVNNFPTTVLKATVALYITHTFDSDLLLELVSPDGVTNVLAAHVGGSGQNFGSSCSDGSRTIFDDSAATSIAVGVVPYIGPFSPEQALSAFIGKGGTNVNGTWHLFVADQAPFDVGTIQCWSLFLTPAVCTDGGGECPGSDLAIAGSAAPEPLIVGGNLVYSISITNRGPKAAKGVTLTQLLPASVVFISANISQGSISYSGGVVSGNIGNMPAGAVVTATVTALPTQAGTLTSVVTAAAVSDPDPDPSNNSVAITSHINPPTSDMAVSMVGTPNPVLIGGTLTYTVSVTNNGPSIATGVVASNALPASAALTSATPSQGTSTILGNAVIFNFGSIGVGGVANATITVIPSAPGLITATVTVTANQFDPQSANNTASVTTAVSPAADLAVGFVGVPAAIVLGANLTYTINATNLGPSTATGVSISQTLPSVATVVSSNSTPGTTLSQSGNTMNCSVGNLSPGGIVTMTVVVSIPTNGNVSSTATISGALVDPNSGNNSATVITLVAAPFVNIQAAGSTLTAESFVPANGAIEPGETVTVQLRLANAGNIFTTNLTAKLLATGGVTSPSAATQTYLPLPPGGFPPVPPKPFSFTASGTNGGVITATLQLGGDASNTVSFTFPLPKVASFANTNVIVIPDVGPGSPYPSTIAVSSITGLVGKVTATLSNFNHTYPHDVSVLLVAPSGANTLLMSHAADLSSASAADLTFDDSAASPLPASGSVSSGSWQPSANAPAPVFFTNAPPAPNPPAGEYGAAMSVFNGSDPNGTWMLFVMDDTPGDSGGVSNGWSLAITTISPVNQVADLSLAGVDSPDPVLAGGSLTDTFTVTNNGPNSAGGVAFTNVLPANVNLISASASQGSVNTNNAGKVVVNLGSLAVGASATIMIVMTPTASGLLSSTATVSANEVDLVPGNNTVTLSTTANLPVADVSASNAATPNPVVAGSNLVYTISVTNHGPGTALNVVLADPLPSSVTFLSASAGTFVSGTLTCNLGNLAPGAGAVVYVTNRAVTLGTITNTATATTGSSDSNPANNSASVSTTIRAPAANIIAGSAKLVSESFTPPDGTVDPGETVSVSLALSDIGEIDTTSLVATLLNTGGVTGSSGAQNYGALVHNGPAASRLFSFTASSAASGVVSATLQLQDGASSLGTVAFTFSLQQTNSFANTNTIIIPDHGNAAPYPSTISVSGLTGLVSKITVTLKGVTHSFPHDIGALLVSPSGAKSVVMSGAGGGNSISNLNLTFDDAAAAALSDTAQIIPGSYKPTDNPPGKTFPTPAPVEAATNLFAKFNGTAPNGVWSLYVVDNAVGDSGVIAGGWSLALTIVSPINSAADLYISASVSSGPVFVGANVTYTLVVTNKGPSVATAVVVSNTLPANAALGTVTHSQGTHSTGVNLVVFNLGSIGVSASATMTIGVNPGVAGLALDAASVSANEADLYLADNSASASVSVLSTISPQLSGVIVNTNQFQITLTGQPSFTYILQASTNMTSWSSISTNTTAVSGVLQFTDTNAPGLQQRFYRAVVPP